MNENEINDISEEVSEPETSGSSEVQEPESTGEETADPAQDKAKLFAADIYDWFDTLFYSILAIITVFTFFTRTSTVDGSSMVPTLEDGQNLLISDFFYTPAYNDIVVVWSETLPDGNGGHGKAIVKRVIGLSGDHISIDYANGTVTRNGVQLPIEVIDGVLHEDGHMLNSYTNDEEGRGGEFTVPDGYLFVMGDNRNGSTDSRSNLVGYIDKRDVVGRAYFRITPFEKFGGLYD